MASRLIAVSVERISLLSRLKEGTRTHHRAVEARLDLPGWTGDAASYRALLELFWGFFRPLEEALVNVVGLAGVLSDLECRLRAGLLARDLAALGLPAGALYHLPRCAQLPPLATLAQALGCLYVLEGSTLGGQIIVGQIRCNQAVPPGACRFFLSHGEQVGPLWKRFGAALEAYAVRYPMQVEDVCESAARTFSSLEAWIAVCGKQRSERNGSERICE